MSEDSVILRVAIFFCLLAVGLLAIVGGLAGW